MTPKDLDFTVTMALARNPGGHCARGVSSWIKRMEPKTGVGLKQFLREGASAKLMWDTEDGHARQIISRIVGARNGRR